ncbi:MAG: SDR family oxidoreductase [Candidatus Hydrogenedentes bacterium]|nr:SDR family oxidoreductase [Candidatus Hydrogenedentota bacterium]
MSGALDPRSVLLTGAGGYLGSGTLRRMAQNDAIPGTLVALDVREIPESDRVPGVLYVCADIRDASIIDLFEEHRFDSLVHLVSVVSPGKKDDRAFLYSVDVEGTKNLLEACVATGVGQIILTSSGAAYGYHADNPQPLHENDPLRGNQGFAYSDHKRLVEEMLAQYRESHPELKQLILRPCTILGETTNNQITAMFHRKRILGLSGAASPFVFIWDRDVEECILKGLEEDAAGIYNVAGTGTLTLREIAGIMDKPYLELPSALVKAALSLLKALGVGQYGPEQVDFLRYRPVLSNEKLIDEFGYTPRKTSREVFDFYLECNRNKG